ncbi:hypothetical protein EXH44_10055 [Actinobacillus indolicus]|uniref:Uncharacterized protein n=1 Tax=Actinobacillus indolicus TaxID=51049 RepID=A0A4P7CHK2_9PAST|nr:DUF6037 family protein [Actinobacillus indolicus]QBQ64538.1 hypothetical protein EXH44_10055 [Actinobacillus indolicus]
MIYMANLEILYNDMSNHNIDVQIYNIVSGAIGFNVCFSINENPFILALTSRTETPEFFKFSVNQYFEIQDSLDNPTYRRLAALLNQGGFQTFYPNTFFNNINEQTPIQSANRPNNQDILAIRQDITEQRDRPYFNTWRHHQNSGHHVTDENKAKTLALLGREAYEYSCRNNASSVWSVEPINR